ncbi:MAG: MBL fold metallo-hydrolase [Lacipirellulaceae bacterium]
MPEYRYVEFPDAKVFDENDKRKQVNHVLFGDWVRLESKPRSGWVKVRVRGTTGQMKVEDLRKDRVLEVVFTDVGQGDGCLVVTPQDKHIVIDAGASDNMHRFLKWRYAGFKRKWTFESAVLTHPDLDHYEGFRKLFEEENVHFKHVYHNGIMEERAGGSKALGAKKKMGGRWHLTELLQTKADLKRFLSDTVRWKKGNSIKKYASLLDLALKSGRVEDISMLHAEASGEPKYLPGYGPDKELQIQVLGPLVERDDNGKPTLRVFGPKPTSRSFDKGKTKNGHSVIFLLRFGDVRLLFGGDLNTSAEAFLLQHYADLDFDWPWSANEEQEIVDAASEKLGCDIAKACHHGSADFLDAFLRATNAAVTVVSSGDEESHAHPRPDTLGAIGLHGRGWRPLLFSTELMRSTREDEGTIPIEIGRYRQKLEDETDPAKRKQLKEALDTLVDKLLERNVTVYGSINLRTDGRNTILAYKLEKERQYGRAITKWDVYPLTRSGNGPLSYKPDGASY